MFKFPLKFSVTTTYNLDQDCPALAEIIALPPFGDRMDMVDEIIPILARHNMPEYANREVAFALLNALIREKKVMCCENNATLKDMIDEAPNHTKISTLAASVLELQRSRLLPDQFNENYITRMLVLMQERGTIQLGVAP